MEYVIHGKNNDIAYIDTKELLIKDTQSALEIILAAENTTDCKKLILNKVCFTEEFFILSSGILGEISQKFINYGIKAAIIGDYSTYTSEPLKDFIYESNNGKDLYFLNSFSEAVGKLE